MTEDDGPGPRPSSTPQEDLELDPQAHDSSGNVDADTLPIEPAKLFEQALEQTRMAITLTDPHQPDGPMIYVNQAFLELTGYEREDVLGRNCRLLQGEESDPDAVQAIRDTIASREVRVVEILNYRKDGSSFWNALHIGPIYDDEGRLTHFYGSQWDVTEIVEKRRRIALQAEVAQELQHRTGNLFGVMSSIVRLSARSETDVAALARKIDARIQALGTAHAISISQGPHKGEAAELADLAGTILKPYAMDVAERIALEGPSLHVPRSAVTPIGLMLHELATNAVKYGALSEPTGSVRVEWRIEGERLALTWTEAGGPEISAPGEDSLGMGSRIIDGVLRTIGASIEHDWPPTGLTATLDMPLTRDKPIQARTSD